MSACKRVRRSEECAEYKGSLPMDELLNYINNENKSNSHNSCCPGSSLLQLPESKNNKKFKKKYSKDSIVQGSASNCFNSGVHVSLCGKGAQRGESSAKNFSDNAKCNQSGRRPEEDVVSVSSDNLTIDVNSFSSEIFVNGVSEKSEFEDSETLCSSGRRNKDFASGIPYAADDSDSSDLGKPALLDGKSNGFCSSSNESCNPDWINQNVEEYSASIVLHESFESCQSSLQGSLSSISSSFSSSKADFQDDNKLSYTAHSDVSCTPSFSHKSVSTDEMKGAKLDVLSSFDEDYSVCLPSGLHYDAVSDNSASLAEGLYVHPACRPIKSEPKAFVANSACGPRDHEKAQISPYYPAFNKSPDLIFGDFAIAHASLGRAPMNKSQELARCRAPSSSSFEGFSGKTITCKLSSPCYGQECLEHVECDKDSSTDVSSRCVEESCCLSDCRRLEKDPSDSNKKQVRAPVEFVNCAVEDASFHNSLGISFGFGLEDLLEKCTFTNDRLPGVNQTAASRTGESVCSATNLNLKSTFVPSTRSTTTAPFGWRTTKGPFAGVDSCLTAAASFSNSAGRQGATFRPAPSPVDRKDEATWNEIRDRAQEVDCESNWSNSVLFQQCLVNTSQFHTSRDATLPSFNDHKLHIGLNLPIRNGFVKSSLPAACRASRKIDGVAVYDAGSRMDELDNCFLPPLFDVTPQKNTFDLKSAQKFLYESYKETLLQSEDKSFHTNPKSKSGRPHDSGGPQKNAKLTT